MSRDLDRESELENELQDLKDTLDVEDKENELLRSELFSATARIKELEERIDGITVEVILGELPEFECGQNRNRCNEECYDCKKRNDERKQVAVAIHDKIKGVFNGRHADNK